VRTANSIPPLDERRLLTDHLYAIDEDIPLRLGREQSDPFLYLCDLLSGFLLQHSYQSHFFVLSSNISAKVATLLYAREKHLRLCKTSRFFCAFFACMASADVCGSCSTAALRFFRTCLRLNNNNLLNHLKKHRVFLPILKLTLRESKRDNLLSSCCQEMFESIRRVCRA
jgi:protein phosphatase-4 regulatory subunit 3